MTMPEAIPKKEKIQPQVAFIGIKHYQDGRNSNILQAIKDSVHAAGITPVAFVEEGKFDSPEEMMRRAFQRIDDSDMAIFEASEIADGVGVEACYAFVKEKKIIYLVKTGFEISRSLLGLSNSERPIFLIQYEDELDLKMKLQEALK